MNHQKLLAPLNQVTARADSFFDQARRLLGSALSCRPGCDTCCHQDLTVVLAEAVSILIGLAKAGRKGPADWARRRGTVGPAGRAAQSDRLAKAGRKGPADWARRRGTVGPAGRAAHHTDGCCALLVDQRCIIYEHRPLVCRTHGLPLVQREGSKGGGSLLIGCSHNSGIAELETVPPETILNAELLTAALGVADGLVRQVFGVEQPIRIAISQLVCEGAKALPDIARERLSG